MWHILKKNMKNHKSVLKGLNKEVYREVNRGGSTIRHGVAVATPDYCPIFFLLI